MKSEKQTDTTEGDGGGLNKTPSDISSIKYKRIQSEGESSISSGESDKKPNENLKEKSTLESQLIESQLISNKENMLGSLVGSNIHFESEMIIPSERQAKQFIQNVEEGMKEYAIVQDEVHSLPTSSDRSSLNKSNSGYEDYQDVIIPSENNSFDELELQQLVNSYTKQKQSKFEEVNGDEAKQECNEEAHGKTFKKSEKKFDSFNHLKEILKSDDNISLKQSDFIEHDLNINQKEYQEDSQEEEFLSEVQEPKTEDNYMPVSYQNSVRNNKLLSELMESGVNEDSSNYISITNNGVKLKNSGLMMDLGIYEMYKESNLMSNLGDSLAEHDKKSDLMSNLEHSNHDEILISAIQMKDSGIDTFKIDPRNSLDKLKAKVIENGELIDSSLFSKRELDTSKRKSLKYESSKEMNFKKEPIKPLMSEMGIGEEITPIIQMPQEIGKKKAFIKSNWDNNISSPKFEEIDNNDEIFISEIKKQETADNPHLIMDTIIPELGINIRQNGLQDSLTAYDESKKGLYTDPEQIKEQFLQDNYQSNMSITMTIDEEKRLEKQRKEIEEFDLLIQSKISNMEEDAYVYRGSDDEQESFKEY